MNTTKLKIHVWPDPILRVKCAPVENIDDNVRDILEQMRVLMHVQNGIGLAANQAGLDMAMVVCEDKGKVYKLINPRIVKTKGRVRFTEGCLSFPGIELEIRRFEKVWVEAQDEAGKAVSIEASGIFAVVLQHEIDHINGIPFIFRVPFWKRLKVVPKLIANQKKKR